MCLLLVWRVYDQAFDRYRPLKGAEKWSRYHHENWKFAHRQAHVEKFTDSANANLFDLRKITKLSWKTVSEQWRYQALVKACQSWIDARRQYILLVYMVLKSVDYVFKTSTEAWSKRLSPWYFNKIIVYRVFDCMRFFLAIVQGCLYYSARTYLAHLNYLAGVKLLGNWPVFCRSQMRSWYSAQPYLSHPCCRSR